MYIIYRKELKWPNATIPYALAKIANAVMTANVTAQLANAVKNALATTNNFDDYIHVKSVTLFK